MHNRQLRESLLASGESFDARRRVQNFVTRAAYLYNLDSVTVWSPDGGLLAANENIIGNMSLHLSNFPMRNHARRYRAW